MTKKVAYIHGRFGPHVMHGRLAKSIGCEFHKVDEYKRWNDGSKSKLFLIYAWLFNAFAFKKPNQYSYYLVSGPHFSPIIMKFFRLNKGQKLICHLGDETMYFLFINWYGKPMQFALKWLLNQYDALFCEGQMAADLAILNGINKPRIYTTYLGVPKERQLELLKIQRTEISNNFICIATGPSGWRTFYKGLDLMIDAFSEAFKKNNSIKFIIVGKWEDDLQRSLLKNCTEECCNAINFMGHTNEIDKVLARADFYLHTSRGDAFPTVVLEAMSAGLIPIVSEWTGSKEVVSAVDPSFVIPVDIKSVSSKILDCVRLSKAERDSIARKMREESKKFNQDYALDHYQKTFHQFVSENE